MPAESFNVDVPLAIKTASYPGCASAGVRDYMFVKTILNQMLLSVS